MFHLMIRRECKLFLHRPLGQLIPDINSGFYDNLDFSRKQK